MSARSGYIELARCAGIAGTADSQESALQKLLDRLEALLELAGFPQSLAESGISPEAIPVLASEAAQQWTASFNPRALTVEDFAALYQAVL
jgi:alcohol dehydrogenase